jgi:hypothetical protein
MTRALCDDRYLSFADLRYYRSPGVSIGGGNGGWAIGPNEEFYGFAHAGTLANGYGRVTVARNVNSNYLGLVWGRSFSGAFLVSGFLHNDARARIIFGGNGNVPANADSNALTSKGFGIEFGVISGQYSYRLFAHNGTSYTTSNSWQTAPGLIFFFERPCAVILDYNGSGGVISARVSCGFGVGLDLRNATPHTITGGPTTLGGGNPFVDCVVVNTNSTHSNTSSLKIYAPPIFFINGV